MAQETPPSAPIGAEGALYLVRSTLIALHQANTTGNYTVLRDLGSPGFRDANDAARLAAIFASLREASLDLTGAAIDPPVFLQPPRLTPEGMLHLLGKVDARGVPATFEMLFEPLDGTWRLFGLSVRPSDGGPPPVDAGPAPAVDGPADASPR